MWHWFKRGAAVLAAQAILTFIWRWIGKLGEHAVLTWVDEQIGRLLGFHTPQASTVISWAVPAFLGFATLLLYHMFWNRFYKASLVQSVGSVPRPASTFPQVMEIDSNRYMTAYEALHYLADDSEWGDQIRQYIDEMDKITIRKNPLLEAPSEFKRIAEQGKIETIGRLNGDGPHVPIPATYWMSAILVLKDREISESIPAVKDIKIVRADVERAWPPPPKGIKKWLRKFSG
jgi:hypothetical protein